MTQRLYYTDCYLREFTGSVLHISPDGATVYLDRTAFYPSSGGQPFDTGTLNGVAVLDVVDEEDRIAHRLAGAIAAGPVQGVIDWTRRFDHMQQHTGQHLLSAVFEEMLGLKTVSFHLGAESSTIDLEGGALTPEAARRVEVRANELVAENRPVSIGFEAASAVEGLRKASEREGDLRIVSIDALDRSACGGTHVRATGEIGAILLRKMEKVRQATRVEFLCGARAVRRARADFELLTRTAQVFSSGFEELPELVAVQAENAREAAKAARKLELDLAAYRGRELYAVTAPGADGMRRVTQRLERGSLEDLRATATSFTSQPKAVFLAALTEPPSVLLAVPEDAGVHAGNVVKAVLAKIGGRGGGSARMAQGSVKDAGELEWVMGELG